MKLLTKQRLTEKELMVTGGKGIVREFGMDMYTLLYLIEIANKDLRYNIWNSDQCFVVAWMGGVFRGEGIHVYVWLSPFTVHLKLSQHC